MFPTQGLMEAPAVESYVHRATGGGLTIWYTGAANQSAHITIAPTAAFLYAYPIVLPGGVIDTIACEVTTLGAGSACRVGLYTNTSDNTLYPASLVLDSGSLDTTTTGVKSTAGLAVAVAPGLYWMVFTCSATAPVMRGLPVGAVSGMQGFPITLGAVFGNLRLTVARAFAALPATFPASAFLEASGCPLGALHFSA